MTTGSDNGNGDCARISNLRGERICLMNRRSAFMENEMKIRINTNKNCYITPIYKVLIKAGANVIDTRDIPKYSIETDGKLTAHIAHADGLQLNPGALNALKKNDYKVIFKYHFSPTIDYGKYSDRIVACGLYRCWDNIVFSPDRLIAIPRKIDVMARMRVANNNPKPWHKQFEIARKIIVKTAINMRKQGYQTRFHKIDRALYSRELAHSKIGFMWTGTAYLGWKIPEFLNQGVIIIHPELGAKYPLREDVILEDDVHYVRCDNPREFGHVARGLLKDEKRMDRIRRNIIDLWIEKMHPVKMGEWYIKKLSKIRG